MAMACVIGAVLCFTIFVAGMILANLHSVRMVDAVRRWKAEHEQQGTPASFLFRQFLIDGEYDRLFPDGPDGQKRVKATGLAWIGAAGMVASVLLYNLVGR